MKKTFLSILILLFTVSINYGSGFQINEHSARAMALGGAFTGLANDPSAVYFNPAGITQLTGSHLMLGSTLILPKSSFRGPSPSIKEYDMDTQAFTPINFYFTQQLSDKFHIGFSVNNPYGLGTRWPKNWVGKYLAIETEIRTFYLNAVASYQVTDQLSIGWGFTYAFGNVKITRYQNLSPFAADAFIDLEGNGTGAGFTAGLLYKPSKTFSVGVSYRSKVRFTFDGDATAQAPKQFTGLIPTGKVSAPLTLPDNLVVGIAVNPTCELTLTADFQYVGWSSYDKLEVDFKDAIDPTTGKPATSSSVRDYKNSYIARVGAEYTLSDNFALRAGLLYDKNPVKDERLDPTLPDADRFGFNGGIGIKITDNLSLDLAYFFLRFDERKITNSLENYSGISDSFAPMNGVYNSTAHLIAANLSIKF